MGTLLQDLRYGARMLLRWRGFTAVAVLALALGIGANTAIFSVVNAVLLRPLPYKDSDQIVKLWENNLQKARDQNPVSPANFVDWRDQNQVFAHIAAYMNWNPNLTGGGESERIQGARVSASLFPLLGVEPHLGRNFLLEEDQPGRNQVVVVSHSLWQRRFGSDPTLLGKTLTLNGRSYAVVGIMPADVQFPPGAEKRELWAPIAFDSDDLSRRGTRYLQVIARLKQGITLKQAKTEMDSISSRIEVQYPQTNAGWGVTLVPLHDQLVGERRPAILVMLGAVGFVLLIACANVANLLLARALARQKEIAIRTALGASRLRLIRQLLTESLLLAVLGGVLGTLLAFWGIKFLVAASPDNIPRVKEINIDGWVLGFTLGISLLTGVVFGLVPAIQASKPDLNESLKEGSRSSAGGFGRHRVRSVLVASEIALALVLLIGAGLMIKSFLRLLNANSGFNPRNVLTAQISLPSYKYSDGQQQTAFYQQLLQRIETLPGVQSAGLISFLPLSGSNMDWLFIVEGRPAADPGEKLFAEYRQVSHNYFQAMGIPLLKGRSFAEHDTTGAPGVILINETFAHRFFPNEDPIGKRIGFGKQPDWREIIGTVADVRHFGLNARPKAEAYVPHLQDPWPVMALVVRTTPDPRSLTAAVRSEVRAIDKDQPIYNVRTMEELTSNSVAPHRLSMILLTVFAVVALVLAAVGIYGVIAYSVTQRIHEIGIRMALGAQPSNVLKLIVGQGMVLALIGVVAGLTMAFSLTRVLSSLLYQVSATDPTVFMGISLMLAGVVLVASYIPARRATKVDSLVALRYE